MAMKCVASQTPLNFRYPSDERAGFRYWLSAWVPIMQKPSFALKILCCPYRAVHARETGFGAADAGTERLKPQEISSSPVQGWAILRPVGATNTTDPLGILPYCFSQS